MRELGDGTLLGFGCRLSGERKVSDLRWMYVRQLLFNDVEKEGGFP